MSGVRDGRLIATVVITAIIALVDKPMSKEWEHSVEVWVGEVHSASHQRGAVILRL